MKIDLNNLTLKQYLLLKDIVKKESEYESRIEFYSDILQITLEKTSDEVESLDIYVFQELANNFNLSDIAISDFENEIKIEGVTYVTSANNNEFTFKVKEMQELEKCIKDENSELDIAAILWREKGENGKPVNDFSKEGIAKRKAIFKEHLTLKYIFPYMDKLAKYLSKQPQLPNDNNI